MRAQFWMMLLLSVLVHGATLRSAENRFVELASFDAAEARQGIAVDERYIYVVGTREIGKYDKMTRERVNVWQADERSPIIHLDSGVIFDGRLYCAHSNYPAVPMTSSVEIWDAKTLKHMDSRSFGIRWGSCTWIDRYKGYWWAAFAQYDKLKEQTNQGTEWTTLVQFDDEWRDLNAWVFPEELVKRFVPMSNSGGSWGPDGRLYCTGHDLPELYALRLPEMGSVLEWVETLPVASHGQGISWDRLQPDFIYGIRKGERRVILSQLIHDQPFLRRGDFWSSKAAKEELAMFARCYADRAEWEKRAQHIREGIRRGAALTTTPEKCPLNPVARGQRTYSGYTVENVAFESLPGFYVSGNLYRPTRGKGPYPAVLCPHGHFTGESGNGRFRPDQQLRCATLAQMGAVVFSYDMVGWGESTQFENYSFPESHHSCQDAVAIQTWNSIRVIDFLVSLTDVDPERIGVTGSSGGGTQTILVTALDDRIAVSVPVVMVSAHFYGGCICESGMPIHQSDVHVSNNAEIAALAAPRPQLLISCGKDWTRNTPEVEFPYIRNVYELYDAAGRVENLHLGNEGHDYGYSKRTGAYHFLAKHLGLSIDRVRRSDGSIDESRVAIEDEASMRVFDERHPMPLHAVKSVAW